MKKILLSLFVLGIVQGTIAQTYFSEDFNSAPFPDFPSGFTVEDIDGDGYNWNTTDGWVGFTPFEGSGGIANSRSWMGGGIGALTPDNYMIMGPIDLTSAVGTVVLQWKCGSMQAGWYEEQYSIYIGTASTAAGLGATTAEFNETLPAAEILYDRQIDISSHVGSSVYIAFRHHNTVDMNMIGIDDIVVQTLPPYDLEMKSISMVQASAYGTQNVTGTVKNVGANTITSFDLTWDSGLGANTETITTSIAPGATYDFTHGTALTISAPQEYSLNICLNEASDTNTANDCLDHSVLGLFFIPIKHVVIEEGTGTWCGWCPRGAVAMNTVDADNSRPNFIGIAVHNSDPMALAAYDAGADFGGYPSMNVNRKYLDEGVSTLAMEEFYDIVSNEPATCDISVYATYDGSNFNVATEVTFATNVATEYRTAVILVENNVTGTTSGYAQTNYYDGGGSGPLTDPTTGFDWTTAGDPVPAANMVYDHVGRALLGGYDGQTGSITSQVAGAQNIYTFTQADNPSWKPWNMKAVGIVINTATGEIVNASEAAILVTEINENDIDVTFNIYPNPAVNSVTIDFDTKGSKSAQVVIVNALGEIVFTQSFSGTNGRQIVPVNVTDIANGFYFVNLFVDGEVVTKKLSINK